jgi:CheY-like chemotaxis protein
MASPLPTILVVDAAADALDMYAVGLSRSGYRVVTAETIALAIERLHHESIGAVVTDVLFTESHEDGWYLIDALKRDPATTRIPVIVLTGYITKTLAETARRAGCAAVLTKPCPPSRLVGALDTLRPQLPDAL